MKVVIYINNVSKYGGVDGARYCQHIGVLPDVKS